ncbi:hypothetical protein KQX54_018901 [Cotesia glomerata]|uniref:Uncharacterized protein n=1 Tax=Cotesia glomerata TaxID=32391 RepID=A0AAV7J7J3_COTGL|nr:hypothetical protein KQX54_018901 [Cotesia glomerata]
MNIVSMLTLLAISSKILVAFYIVAQLSRKTAMNKNSVRARFIFCLTEVYNKNCKLMTHLPNMCGKVETKGISGPIEFKEGRRIQFKLDLLKLKQHSLVKVGEWRPDSGVNITDVSAFFEQGIVNVTLTVITIPVSLKS